ncbi:MAG: thioesterase [Calditrichaeota bacterium]|nr:thioesterase [Calditrichota bacterium]
MGNPDSIQKLQQVLETEIPITRTMGIRVQEYDGQQLVLAAPLTPNINHKSTAFGGSLYSLAVLNGWGLLYLKMQELNLDSHIVIFESSILYHLPVKTDFVSVCKVSDDEDWRRFLTVFRRKGRAKIRLLANILTDEGLAVSFQGTYVAHL